MKPLEGLRVLDLSQQRTGAQATQVLADFGADVMWVEPPGGSGLRESNAFPFYCRGKQSIVLDLKSTEGRDHARDLAAIADVIVECFRPGVADRLGLSYAELSAVNPGLVYTSISGFGRTSPLAGIKAYEGVVQAKIGAFKAFERMGDGDRPPFVAAPWCSFSATQTALHGTLAALLEREGSGLGQWVEATMAQGFAALDTWDWFLDLITQRFPDAYSQQSAFDNGIPASPIVYMLLVAITRDGHWLQFAQVAPHLYLGLMKALDLTWMFTDPQWQGIPLFPDPERRLAYMHKMQEAVAAKTLEEWQEVFDADPDVFAEVFRQGAGVLEHPQLIHDGQVVEVVDPHRGVVRQPAALADIKQMEADPTRPAPVLDEHQGWSDTALPTRKTNGSTAMPLAGVTVLEFATMYAAPYGATLLTDLGARVIKVEPLSGDPIRGIMPFPEVGGAKVMQGKESICVDITKPDGLAIIQELVRGADVVLSGYRAGVPERLGIDADTLRAINPDLIFVSANGYGEDGPCGNRPAFAPSIGAASGVSRANVGMNVQQSPGLGVDETLAGAGRLFSASAIVQAQADGFAALGVTSSVLLGLLARERTGVAPRIASSMLATAVQAMAEEVVHSPGQLERPGVAAELRGPNALYRIYDARDGWIFLAIHSEQEWKRFVGVTPFAVSLASDERFATVELRRQNDSALADVLAGVFSSADQDEWETTLTSVDVGCVTVGTQRIERFFQSEDIGHASGYVVEVEHPTFDRHLRLAPLVRFSRSLTQAKAGVLAGSATDDVLAELGRGPEQITDLRAREIVGG
ncbi:MAG TPA: CoA transferase [Mycobacteriales bacterium]|nr:CoA transferase [Mycobacteriales bacterium]